MSHPILKLALCLCSALCVWTATPQPASADVTIALHMSVNMPGMPNMPGGQNAMIDRFLDSTMYIAPKEFRYNTAFMSVIADPADKKMTFINDTAKTYSIMPYDPAAARAMMPGGAPGGGALKEYKAVDTGRTTTFLGHKVRHYIVTEVVQAPNMGDMTIHADVLAAQDLPNSDMDAYQGLSNDIPGTTHMKGIPLKMVMKMAGGPVGTMTLVMQATSVSTAPIPASTFQIPEGYTQTTAPTAPGQVPMMPPGAPGQPPGNSSVL